MYFEQFYLACLSHASYMIASTSEAGGPEGEAAVIDPQRDIGIYLDEAAKHGFQIRHIIETHLHADFVSGHRELAERTGAKIYLGAKAGAQFPHVPVKDGDELTIGELKLKFLETPGHTIESISIVVDDKLVFTGDTLFIGDVGRPDLAPDLTPQQLAGMLYDSLHDKLMKLPDDTLVYPAHGAGSLCGRQMSTERSSTIGKQRATNYALRAASKEEFVQLLTSELPQRPGYFSQDVEINRTGAAALTELPPLAALTPDQVIEKQKAGAVVLDTRPPMQFAVAHIAGSIQIGLSGQFASWAGIVLGLNQELVIVAEDEEQAKETRLRLARVGIERVAGYLDGGITNWIREGRTLVYLPHIDVDELRKLLEEDPGYLQVLDVRKPAEFEAGHISGAILKPVDQLAATVAGLDPERPVAVYCKTGYRSSIASSLLERAGFKQVINLTGGYDAWMALAATCTNPLSQAS
jgi:hydroxyacylglutathione hydrolase